jgi:RNA polymerase sigma factor (sigma-70 family)
MRTVNSRSTRPTVEELYRHHYALLRHLAIGRFRVPEEDAYGLIQEIFIAYIERAATVENPRSWLVGSICHASRHYWRKYGRYDQLPENFEQAATVDVRHESVVRLDLQTLMRRQTSRCRELLSLRYVLGCSIDEVAEHFRTTSGYVRKLLHQCTVRARATYRELDAR